MLCFDEKSSAIIFFFRECWSILQEKQWNNDQHRKDFESGVRMGVGAFNLLISLLPARVMKVLEFNGESCEITMC